MDEIRINTFVLLICDRKQDFKTLREAKEYFQIKANSWESLVNKLHQSSLPNNGLVIYLEPDVAEIFPNSQSVNEALRLLIVNQKKMD